MGEAEHLAPVRAKKTFPESHADQLGQGKSREGLEETFILTFYQVAIPLVISFNLPPLKCKYPFQEVMPQSELLQMLSLLSFSNPISQHLLGIVYEQDPVPDDRAED